MMHKNRKSVRLKNYDYSQNGFYFITICANHKKSIFGRIENDIVLNDAGLMIEQCYFELENRFQNIKCHEMVVMPNHFHCIIEITNNIPVGVPLVGTQCCCAVDLPNQFKHGQPQGLPLRGVRYSNDKNTILNTGQPQGIAPTNNKITIGDVVGAFKSITTNEYIYGVKNNGWLPFDKKMWQRNYWEHIIRDEKSFIELSEYIKYNPLKWESDSLNPNKEEKQE